ncbi:DUF4293 domain-containing protein [Prevotella sp. kh1p2]|uniref:DUF4293 domain-containing protein n=1 Tax=Prevotella sp. kh1p2 TaxID=1761883 RepID=UPI0008BF4EEB|nr:DUF4293 domain-containing protein [Prevotella sp. kh1p2]SET23886.1 protein of unknown function [Prevotella sp. kh1p2]SNU12355.1 protein of unknown function [Prevotellaceae bacterium KH2P17]
MIQRKQTLWLLAAFALSAICLCLPLASYEPKGMGVASVIYNLGVTDGEGVLHFSSWPLFAMLSLSSLLAFIAIFLFKNRKLQMKLCMAGTVLNMAWYVYMGIVYFSVLQTAGAFRIKFALCLPLVALIFLVLARKAIKSDEDLVRSMDRIR